MIGIKVSKETSFVAFYILNFTEFLFPFSTEESLVQFIECIRLFIFLNVHVPTPNSSFGSYTEQLV